jgi:hypothetical protein
MAKRPHSMRGRQAPKTPTQMRGMLETLLEKNMEPLKIPANPSRRQYFPVLVPFMDSSSSGMLGI